MRRKLFLDIDGLSGSKLARRLSNSLAFPFSPHSFYNISS